MTGMLRRHLNIWHLLEYIIAARERSWIPQLSEVAHAMDLGYDLESLERLVRDNVDIASLTPRVGLAPAATDADPTGRNSIPPFSQAALQQFLISFILADDQVSILLVL